MRDGPGGGGYGLFGAPDPSPSSFRETSHLCLGFEFYADPTDPLKSYVAWIADGQRTHTVYGSSVGPDTAVEIGPRLVAAEPMVCGIENSGLL